MAEIQLIRIKSIYGQIKGIYKAIKNLSGYSFPSRALDNFNSLVDQLSKISNSDYSNHKLFDLSIGASNDFDVDPVKITISSLITRLEEEYGFGSNSTTDASQIVIINKNTATNEVKLEMNYTINDLIKESQDKEAKKILEELRTEIDKPLKNWEKIKQLILWILNFSKDLFLKIIPIILEKKL